MSSKTIVLAYDGSEGSEKALAWAVNFAQENVAVTHIISVYEPIMAASLEPTFNVAQLDQEQRTHLEQLALTAKTIFTNHHLETKVILFDGHPADEILKYAKKIHPDLIVCGTRGHGNFSAIFLGSVAHRLVTYASAPVLVIK